MSFNIAIDGPAGAGKSTVAKMIAKNLNLMRNFVSKLNRTIGFVRTTIILSHNEA